MLLEILGDLRLVICIAQRILPGDIAFPDQAAQVHIQGVHAVIGAYLHHGRDLMGLALADQVQDAVGAYKKLCGGDTGYASATGNQALADDSPSRCRQLERTWFWPSAGQASMIRSTVWAAPVVCRVDSTR